MLLVFCTDDDPITAANLPIARHLANAPPGLLLEGERATREELFIHIENRDFWGMVLMGHGSRDTVAEQGGGDAIRLGDFQSHNLIPALAYSCYSAHMGLEAASRGLTWWGYDNVMQPPPLDIFRQTDVENIFRHLAHHFWNVTNNNDVLKLISEIKDLCDELLEKYEVLGGIPMSCSFFARHIWSRLRVWLPFSAYPLAHPEVFPGELDWRD